VRETGLYHLCFRRLGGSSSIVNVFYSFDFVSTGNAAALHDQCLRLGVLDH
jgi:hypothetical protein